jgi:hypothetical protein
MLRASVAMAQLITTPDDLTSGTIVFLQSWKDTAVENYAAPTMCVCTVHTNMSSGVPTGNGELTKSEFFYVNS